MKLPVLAIFLFVIASSNLALADILIHDYSSPTNDRFQNADNPDQFFVPFTLSGVGQNGSGVWATLIGPNTIISAFHLRPSGVISFFPNNLSTSTPVQIAISSDVQRIGNTDLWLARLEQHAPSSIHIFNYAMDQISAPVGPNSEFAYKGNSVIMTGRSPGGFPATQDQAYGTNIISWFVENDTSAGLGSVDAFRLDYNPGATPYEAFLRTLDSGAPLFTDDGTGNLLLLGVNSYVTTSQGAPVSSFVSYIGNEAPQINALVSQWAAVPEPSTLGFLSLSSSVLCFARRRRTISV